MPLIYSKKDKIQTMNDFIWLFMTHVTTLFQTIIKSKWQKQYLNIGYST